MVLASTKGANTVTQLFSDIVVLKELTLSACLAPPRRDITGRPGNSRWTLGSTNSSRTSSSTSRTERFAAGGLLGREELISVAVTF